MSNPNEYDLFYKCLKKWFVGAVKTLYDPRYVHKQSIIFQGKQNIGKTPFIVSLLPHGMEEFIAQSVCLDPRQKDHRIALTTKFIMFFDELDKFLKPNYNRDNYKAYMSERYVNVRPPYGKIDVSRPRIASFIGGCNGTTFLKDETGSSRFSIFAVEKFYGGKGGKRPSDGKDMKVDFDPEKVWAQAYHLYKSGFDPEYSIEEVRKNEVRNDSFKVNVPEYEVLVERMVESSQGSPKSQFQTSTDICNHFNANNLGLGFHTREVGKALRRLGYTRFKKRVNGKSIYGYWVEYLDEINRQKALQIEDVK